MNSIQFIKTDMIRDLIITEPEPHKKVAAPQHWYLGGQQRLTMYWLLDKKCCRLGGWDSVA